MKKKILTMLLSFVLCANTAPLSIFATTNYENSYISIVQSTMKRNKIEAIELQFLKLASINRDDDIIKSVQSISKLDIAEYLEDKNNLISIIPENIVSKDTILKPLKELSNGDTKSFLNSMTDKILAINNTISSDSFNNLPDNKKYSILLYMNNCINSIALFDVKDTNAIKLFEGFDRTTLVNKLSELEGKSTNELEVTSGKIFSEETSAYKAKSIKEALYTSYNEGSDFFVSKEIIEGKALSAAYVPFRTNINDNKYLSYVESTTFKPFYNTYGKLRKGVLIANSKNAVTQFYLTGQSPGFRPATLRDFTEKNDKEKLFIVDPGYYNSNIPANYEFQGEDKKINYKIGNNVYNETEESSTVEESSSETTSESETKEEAKGIASIFSPRTVYGKETNKIYKTYTSDEDMVSFIVTILNKLNDKDNNSAEKVLSEIYKYGNNGWGLVNRNVKDVIDAPKQDVINALEYSIFTSGLYKSQQKNIEKFLGDNFFFSSGFPKLSKVANKVVAIKNLSSSQVSAIASELKIEPDVIYSLIDKIYWTYVYLIAGSGSYALSRSHKITEKTSVESLFYIISNEQIMSDIIDLSIKTGMGTKPNPTIGEYEVGTGIGAIPNSTIGKYNVVTDGSTRAMMISHSLMGYAGTVNTPSTGLTMDALVTALKKKNTNYENIFSRLLVPGENNPHYIMDKINVNSFSLPSVDTIKDFKDIKIHEVFRTKLQERGDSGSSANSIADLIRRNFNPINLLFSNQNLPSAEDYKAAFGDSIVPDSLNLYLTALSWTKKSSNGNTLIDTFKSITVNSNNESGLGSDYDSSDDNLKSLHNFLQFYNIKTSSFNSVLEILNRDENRQTPFNKQLQEYLGVNNIFDIISNGGSLSEIMNGLTSAISDAQLSEDKKQLGQNKELDPIFRNLNTVEGLTESGIEEFRKTLNPEAMRSIWPTYVGSEFDLRQPVASQASLLQSELLYNVINTNVTLRLTNQNTVPNEWYGIALNNDIYKDLKLLDIIAGSMNKPIYRVAPNLKEASFFDATYNYLYLENISEKYPLRYDLVNDLDMPVFVDIFGNIVTYSGYVIVPFANNATMHTSIPLLNNSFLTSYGDKQFIENKYHTVDKTYYSYINKTVFDLSNERTLNNLSDYSALNVSEDSNILILDEEEKKYILNPIIIETEVGNLDLSRPSTSDSNSSKVLYNIMLSAYTSDFENSIWNSNTSLINVGADMANIYQVVRGAPKSNINIETEKLGTSILFNKTALDQGSKYEQLHKNLSEVEYNGLISVPDISTNRDIEQILYLFYKMLFIIIIVFICIQIFVSVIKQRLTLFSILHIFVGSILIITLVINIPTVHKLTYYYVNRTLLQNEAKSIVLLNSEKAMNNSELGISDIDTRDISSKISLKVAELNINKAKFFTEIFDTFNGKDLNSLYNQYYESDLETSVEEYETRGKYLYYSVDDLFKTSSIDINTKTHQLSQHTVGTPAIAFRLPYYAILDYLIYQVNTYNEILDSYQYSLVNMGEGYRSQGLVERYFKGNGFLLRREDILRNNENIPKSIDKEILDFAQYDRSGILNIYGSEEDRRDIFPNKEYMQKSIWYIENIDKQILHDLSIYLDKVAREWVESNRSILGKITDETILKSLALELSLAYNRYLSIPGPQYYEIDKMDSSDLLRLMVLPKDKVAFTSTLSFPRLILQETGIIGIIIASYLSIIITVLSIAKPLSILASVFMLVSALIIMKLILNKSNNGIYGAIKFFLLVSGINISYCIFIKGMILLTNILPPLICLLLISIIQTIFLSIYIWTFCFCIRNWKDAGNSEFNKLLKVKTEVKINKENNETHSSIQEYNKLIERDKERDNIVRNGRY